MYSYHLWIVLSESPQESDTGSLKEKLAIFKDLVTCRLAPVPSNAINPTNCDWVFQCSVSHNHKGDGEVRLRDVLNWIEEHLPGSYGLVYIRDDEDPATPESFRVIVIARGRISERIDPFLSPVVPTIED